MTPTQNPVALGACLSRGAWKAGTPGSEGAGTQQCVPATRRWRIQRRPWRSRTGKKAVYTYPSKKALASVVDKVRTLTRRRNHRTLADLLRRLNPVLRGWCTYFRHGVSARTFSYVDHFALWRIIGWLSKRHLGLNMHTVIRRYLPGWEVRAGRIEMFRPRAVAIERYRYRGTKIRTPWTSAPTPGSPAPAA